MTRRTKRLSKVDRAKRIIRAIVRSGNQRATVVHRSVVSQGISTRTYRTARKQMHTLAVRRSKRGTGRGTGRGRGAWYVGLR